jgi:hypothetical protein
MDIEEFNNLTLTDRAEILWDVSRWMDSRAIYNKYLIELYDMKGTFVEVYIDAHTQRIDNIKAISEEDMLREYVHLEDLFRL